MIPLSFLQILKLLRAGQISDDMAFIIIQLLTEKYGYDHGCLHDFVEDIHRSLCDSQFENEPPYAAVLLKELQTFQQQFSGCSDRIDYCLEANDKHKPLFS